MSAALLRFESSILKVRLLFAIQDVFQIGAVSERDEEIPVEGPLVTAVRFAGRLVAASIANAAVFADRRWSASRTLALSALVVRYVVTREIPCARGAVAVWGGPSGARVSRGSRTESGATARRE